MAAHREFLLSLNSLDSAPPGWLRDTWPTIEQGLMSAELKDELQAVLDDVRKEIQSDSDTFQFASLGQLVVGGTSPQAREIRFNQHDGGSKKANIIAIRFSFQAGCLNALLEKTGIPGATDSIWIGQFHAGVRRFLQNYCIEHIKLPAGCALVEGDGGTLLFACICELWDALSVMAQISTYNWFKEIPNSDTDRDRFEEWFESAKADDGAGGAPAAKKRREGPETNMGSAAGGLRDWCFGPR